MILNRFSQFLLALLILQLSLLVYAQECQPGTFKDGTSCTRCPENTVSTTTNATSCEKCPLRFLPNKKRTQCVLCPPGNFISAAKGFRCIPCEIGKYNPESGATDCITCPQGRVTFFMGAKSPLQCGNCPKGFYLLFGETDVTCTFCASGFYSDEENATFCKRCPKGTFSYVGSPKCTDCPPGTFGISPLNGVPGCKKCPDASYQNLEGQNECLPCPTNSTPARNRKKCKPTCEKTEEGCRSCAPGWGYNEFKAKCRPCRPDTVSIGRSATGCHPCPEGTFPNDKLTKCICPNGTGFIDGACRECPFNAEVVNDVECVCMGDFLLRDGGCLCPPGQKPVGFKCVQCTNAEKKELVEEFRGPCEYCEAGHFWNVKTKQCETCPIPNANPTRNFASNCSTA